MFYNKIFGLTAVGCSYLIKKREKLSTRTMAYCLVYDVYPDFYVGIPIESDIVLLLIEEVIDFSLHHHNMPDWNPIVNLEFFRMNTQVTLFNLNFATNVVSLDTEQEAIQCAYRLGFDEETWLEYIDHQEAIGRQEYYLTRIFYHYQPCLLQIFSFACYAIRIALQRNQGHLVNAVVWALLFSLRQVISPHEYFGVNQLENNVHLYDDQLPYVDNPPSDVDEGIVDITDADRRNNEGFIYSDPLFLFSEELIDFHLRFNDVPGWIPPINLSVLQSTVVRYFTENIGRIVSHFYRAAEAVNLAREWSFDEDIWSRISNASEARHYQGYFFTQVFQRNQDLFSMFSFACYSSMIAIQRNRNSLANEVVWALVNFLRRYFPHQEQYSQLNVAASYRIRHHLQNSHISDEGVEDVFDETVNDEENIAEERAQSPYDNEENVEEADDGQEQEARNEANGLSESQSNNQKITIEERQDGQDPVVRNEANRFSESQSNNQKITVEERQDAQDPVARDEAIEETEWVSDQETEERSDIQGSFVGNEAKRTELMPVNETDARSYVQDSVAKNEGKEPESISGNEAEYSSDTRDLAVENDVKGNEPQSEKKEKEEVIINSHSK